MKKKSLWMGIGLLAAFGLWTILLGWVDVQSVGPGGSQVGFAALNQWVHHRTGVRMVLYHITDWLGLIPLAVVAGFGVLGLCQWICRKRLSRVDCSLLVLGGFYLVVLAVYVLFEKVAVNYRPVLIEGRLEASYPSSTTMLALCVMPTAAMQLRERIRHKRLRRIVTAAIVGFTAFMVLGRLFSGVHWFSDILGGGLLSASLVMLYHFVRNKERASR